MTLAKNALDSFISKMEAEKAFEGVWFDRFNIRPSQLSPIIDYDRKIHLAQFGLLPSWAKDPKIANSLINARSETLSEKPSFRKPFKYSRCGVIADGYYEWRNDGTVKQPFYFKLKSGKPFVIAGLCDDNTQASDHPIKSFAVITVEAPDKLSEIHHRVPVILNDDEIEQWLNPDFTETDLLTKLLQPISQDELEWWPVSTMVNRPANDSFELVRHI